MSKSYIDLYGVMNVNTKHILYPS